jgi:hypothetical protein
MSTRRRSHGLGYPESKRASVVSHGDRAAPSISTVTPPALAASAVPEWKQLNAIKQTIRTESENTIAEALQPVRSP